MNQHCAHFFIFDRVMETMVIGDAVEHLFTSGTPMLMPTQARQCYVGEDKRLKEDITILMKVEHRAANDTR